MVRAENREMVVLMSPPDPKVEIDEGVDRFNSIVILLGHELRGGEWRAQWRRHLPTHSRSRIQRIDSRCLAQAFPRDDDHLQCAASRISTLSTIWIRRCFRPAPNSARSRFVNSKARIQMPTSVIECGPSSSHVSQKFPTWTKSAQRSTCPAQR